MWVIVVVMRLVVVIIALQLWYVESYAAEAVPPEIQVCFSPSGGCTAAVTNELGRARTTVLVQAYSFTSPTIAKALADAHKRGVTVQVILDSSQRSERYSSADFIYNAGISCLIDDAHAIAHNKVMIIDGRTVITGSFNFTKSAEERNAENLLIIRDTGLATKYTGNWVMHSRHSVIYTGKPNRSTAAPVN